MNKMVMNMGGHNPDYYYELHPVGQFTESGMQKFVMVKKKRIVVGTVGQVVLLPTTIPQSVTQAQVVTIQHALGKPESPAPIKTSVIVSNSRQTDESDDVDDTFEPVLLKTEPVTDHDSGEAHPRELDDNCSAGISIIKLEKRDDSIIELPSPKERNLTPSPGSTENIDPTLKSHFSQPVKTTKGRREPDRTKKHKCNYCDRRFVRPAEVKRHEVAIHTTERQFKCSFCPWTFKRKDHVMSHIQSVHSNTTFACTEKNCHYTTARLDTLKRHQKTRHQKVLCSNRQDPARFKTAKTAIPMEEEVPKKVDRVRPIMAKSENEDETGMEEDTKEKTRIDNLNFLIKVNMVQKRKPKRKEIKSQV